MIRASRALRSALLALVLLGAGACGAKLEPLEPSTAGVEVLRLRWVKRFGPPLPNFFVPEMVEEHDRFNPVETSAAGFDSDMHRAFIGAAVGGLYCLDLRDGATVWRYSLDHAVGSTPLYDADRKRVYFGADDGKLYALHARSGRLIWETETGAEIRRGLRMVDDTLYVANADNTVLAIDPQGGEQIWRHRRQPIEGFSAAGYADIAIHAGKVLAAFSDGMFVALDAISGAVLWSNDLASEVVAATREGAVNLTDADATPVIVGRVAAAASVAGGLYGVDVESGNVLWTRPDLDRITGLAVANDLVYAARAGFGLTAVDPRTGRAVWSRQFGLGVLQDPLVVEDVLLIADSEAGLFVVASGTGEVLQRVDQQEGFFARPSGSGGYLLILGNRGTLYAMTIN